MPRTPAQDAHHQGALLITYLAPQRRKVALLAALLLANIGLQLTNPLILRTFIDAALARQPLETLAGIAGLFLVVALCTQGIAVAETYVAEDLGWTATNRLRADLALHLLRLDMGFHNTRTPGELLERVDGDVTALANFFSRFVLLVVGNLVLLVGVLIMLWREDARVGLALTAFAAGALVVLVRSRRIGVAASTDERQASARLFGFLEERLAGLDDIRANGANAYVMRRLYERMRELFDQGRRAFLMRAVVVLLSVGLWTLGYVLAMALGATLFNAGAISLGTVYLILAYTDTLRRPLDQITNQLQDLQKASASTIRIQELTRLAPAITDGPRDDLPAGPLAVAFDGVTFAYPGGDPVLSAITVRLAPGTVLGVVGRTGSGKSTLSRLLLRLYDPQQGTIRLGGVAIQTLRLDYLRQQIGIVTQDVQLFRASVRDNLTLFDPGIPDARIHEVLRDLGLYRWYQKLPAGLDTELEAGGGGLSAGQAQLLAFARVFLRDPGLVILDEASSRLDPATERLIQHAIDRLLRGRTAIIIAHRLGTIARADAILVLDAGRIREYGPRAQVARDQGSRFYELLQTGLEEVPA
ncbi:MAG TPA: ABC transporter ATP-binding protein [Chloroflexia bacterium]|nr:ABC transporter ATP-binding protein [Chloroflexia bacterium]